jgi:hypothetical protein
MRFLPLCRNDDPLLKIVKEAYHAQPVAMPRGSIALLDVLLEAGGDEYSRWGQLGTLVTGQPGLKAAIGPARPKLVANLSGVRSSTVDIDVGLELVGFILRVFGLPVPGVAAGFKRARTISFKFSSVTERLYSAATIGHALERRRLRKRNAANREIVEKGGALVINSVLESPDFAVRVEKRSGKSAGLDFGLLKELGEARAGISIQQTGAHEVSWHATKPAVFAFTALRLRVAEYGGIESIQLGPPRIVLRALTDRRDIIYGSEYAGLDTTDVASTGVGDVIQDRELLAIDVPGRPLVVNAAPVELNPEPALLIPDN